MCVRHDKLCTYKLILSAIGIRLMHVMSNHKGADASKDYVEDYDCIGGHVNEYDDGGDGNYMVGEDDRGPGGIARISALLGLMQLLIPGRSHCCCNGRALCIAAFIVATHAHFAEYNAIIPGCWLLSS